MRRQPSKRNLDVVSFLDQGHTLHETAAHFLLENSEVERIVRLTRDYQEALSALEDDPGDLMLLARCGRLMFPAARALAEKGIHKIGELRGMTARDLMCTPKIGRGAVDQIVKLAAERGIEIHGSRPSGPTPAFRPPHLYLREHPRTAIGIRPPQRREIRRK